MTVKIPGGFFLNILLECLIQINACLVGDAHQNKYYIGEFIGKGFPANGGRSGRLFTGPVLPSVSLLPVFCVNQDGYRAVVCQF